MKPANLETTDLGPVPLFQVKKKTFLNLFLSRIVLNGLWRFFSRYLTCDWFRLDECWPAPATIWICRLATQPSPGSLPCKSHTDKKENQIFLIYKEIQNGAVAKSYRTNSLLIWWNICAFPHKLGALPHIWLCNCSTLNFLIYMRKILFNFLSVHTILYSIEEGRRRL